MSACALGLDLGTSSAKAVVLDPDGTVLAQASAGYPVTSAAPGQAESDPALWWAAVTACARQAMTAARARPAAIGLSGQMHGLVMTAADGRAVRPALLWADSRATGPLRAYRRLGGPALARLANPPAPGMAGPMLAWIAEHEPEAYAAARWMLAPKDWIRARLTGESRAEPSDASATLLYDLIGDRWDVEVTSALGLDPGLLAPLLPSGEAVAGHLTAGAAAELGLPAGLPVAAGAGDTAAAALDALLDRTLLDGTQPDDYRPPQLRVAGGGTLAAGWRQLLADVLGLPLYAVDVPAASGRGAALLGAVAAGLLGFGDCTGPLAPPARLVAEPAITAHCSERYVRFQHAISALREREGPS